MILMVCGSREADCRDLIERELDSYCNGKDVDLVVEGGARGVDSMAADWARKRGMKLKTVKPDWKRYGRGAGLRRNTEMVEMSDTVIAFWDGKSRGTSDSIQKAQKLGKNLIVFGI